ncbi:DUF3240 family protein [Methylomicrobium sp. RS1]|uniref:DUF3240 family protein n=1 Tax=Candidatus Methylomicrobium oryzae TaxID=2802053 RepID=UPI001921A8E1|nr:DUF3240 family protein [Methylomicrobium sp. RS1]MBL1262105.1 DUF3240 family protein [Methylomicrobium sp. RS1]
MSNKEFLVTLNVPIGLEEAIVDCLLTFESEHGFSSFPVYAHDHRNEGLSLAEQVFGRQKRIRFQMHVEEAVLSSLLAQLREEFAGAGIRYWVMPVIDNGFI